MKEYKFIKDEIIKKHDRIDSYEHLDEYINFLVNYELKDNVEYTENHHILPRSMFPEFENEIWNIVKLDYDDHRLSHVLIYKAINIRKYQRPLNWMMRQYKNSTELSNASKRGWDNFRNNKEKYDMWRSKRSTYMKNLPPSEQSRRAHILWDNISDERYLEFCNNSKEYWTDERKLKKSNDMYEFYKDPLNIIKKRQESQKRWDEMDKKDIENFKKKMSIVNKGTEKRRIAGLKIKKLWKNEEYLKKMKNRRKNPGIKLRLIKENGEEMLFENMRELTNIYGFSPYKIRKYINKNIKISKKHLKEKNMILLNCIIESI